MKRGPDYIHWSKKRAVDVRVAGLLLPMVAVGEAYVSRKLAHADEDLPAIVVSERIGHGRETFPMQQFRTCPPGSTETYGDWADTFRRLGVDELPQLRHVRDGDMSLTGFRPLPVADYEEVREALPPKLGKRWDMVLDQGMPGYVSPYSLYSHTRAMRDPDNEPLIRAEMDVAYFMNASAAVDAHLIRAFVEAGLGVRGLHLRDNTRHPEEQQLL